MTPEKRVEEIVDEYKLLMGCEVLTVWDERTGDEVFLPDWLRQTLTALHTSLIAAVKGKIAHEEKIEEHIEKVGADKVYTNGKKAAYQDTLTIINSIFKE